MSTKERLRIYIDFKGITQSEFCSKAGISNGFLTNNGEVGSGKLQNILTAYPDLSIEWLVTGYGDMIKTTVHTEIKEITNNMSDKKLDDQYIPVYDMNATAGIDELLRNSGNKPIPIDYIKLPQLPKCDGAVSIKGDSMYPLIKTGDIVVYKILNNFQNIMYGEMYLVYIENDGDEIFTIKYIQKSEKLDHVKLVSYNQHHQPQDFPLTSIKTIARVQASVRLSNDI